MGHRMTNRFFLTLLCSAAYTAAQVADAHPQLKFQNPSIAVKTTAVNLDCQADVILVVDRSERVGDANFNALKKFLVDDFTNLFPVDGDNKYRISMVTFSGDVKVEFHLGELKSNAEVTSKIQQIQYFHPGATNTAGALNAVVSDVLNSTNYTPVAGSRTIVVLFTYGVHDVGGDPKLPAEQLRMGPTQATIVSVGIGPLVDLNELISISAGKPLIFTYGDVTQIGNEIVYFVSGITCKSASKTKRN